MSLLRALYVIEEQTENDKLREVFVEVRKDVEAGVALSEALERHPDVFNDLYVAMVPAGETGRHPGPDAGPGGRRSSRRTPRCGARSRRRWSTRR